MAVSPKIISLSADMCDLSSDMAGEGSTDSDAIVF